MYKRIQGNGSVTIPSKIRHRLGLEPHDALELVEQQDGSILLQRYNPQCIWCGSEDKVLVAKGVRMCLCCYNKIRPKEEPGNDAGRDDQ